MRVPLIFKGLLIAGLSLANIASSGAQEAGSETPPERPEKTIQIQIVNQDGEQVEATVEAIDPDAKAGPGRVQAKDGKLIVVGPDGKKRQLDISGAASVVLNQSVQTTDENGDQKTKRTGKMIIVGPDGKREVIDLENIEGDLNLQLPDELPNLDMVMPSGQGVFRFQPTDNEFMIGVFCEPVSDALASQLRLPSDSGLVVIDVGSDSPADQAGLETHDVLLYAGQEELASQEDLVKAVQEAGKNERSLSLTIIRGGKESSLDIKPVKRPANAANVQPKGAGMKLQLFPKLDPQGRFEFRMVEPGAILDVPMDGVPMNWKMQQDLEVQMKQMEDQMRQMRERIEQEFKNRKLPDSEK